VEYESGTAKKRNSEEDESGRD